MYEQIVKQLGLQQQPLNIAFKAAPSVQRNARHAHLDRGRREFRGDRTKPKLDQGYAYDWFDRVTRMMGEVESCKTVQSTYEQQVARYGYSLYDLKKVADVKLV